MNLFYLLLLPILTILSAWIKQRRTVHALLALLWCSGWFYASGLSMGLDLLGIFSADQGTFLRMTLLYAGIALFSKPGTIESKGTPFALTACSFLALASWASQHTTIFLLVGLVAVCFLAFLRMKCEPARLSSIARGRRDVVLLWGIVGTLGFVFLARDRSIFAVLLPIFSVGLLISSKSDETTDWQRWNLWSLFEAFFLVQFPAWFFTSGGTQVLGFIEGRSIFLMMSALMVGLVVLAFKASSSRDWMGLMGLLRAALLISALILPEGGMVLNFLAVTWWIPYAFVLVDRLHSISRDTAERKPGNKTLGILGLALMIGWPPFSELRSFGELIGALAMPSTFNAFLWVFPVIAMGVASIRVPFPAGDGWLFKLLLWVSLAFSFSQNKVILVLIVAGAIFHLIRSTRPITETRPFRSKGTS